ncbi:MAG: hypothetical protein ACR2JV_09790 [Gaiellales bacterium]
MADDAQRPSLRHRWEDLEIGKQFVIALPVMAVLIAVIHWTLLNQPAFRGGLYGVFWAVPAAGIIAIASQNEGSKRRKREATADEQPLDGE